MESIDRLRDEIESARKSVNITSRVAKKLFDISDAIEQEAMADRTAAYNEGAMAEHGWVRLPVDAEGVPIHVGDVMESDVDHLFDEASFKVCAIWLDEGGWEVVDSLGDHYNPDVLCHHHHAPTVEDVLQEMLVQAVGYSDANTTVALNTIAEYAAKLRLAGDE